MDVPNVLTTFILMYLIYCAYNHWRIRAKLLHHGVSYKGAWPFFGNMGSVLLQKLSFHDVIENAYKMCPKAKFVAIFDFQRPMILLRDPDLIKSVTVKHADTFVNHQGISNSKYDPFFGNILFNLKGHHWRHIRAQLTPAFTSCKMKVLFDVIMDCSKDFTKGVAGMIKDAQVVEMKGLISKFGSDVIVSSVLGIKVDSMKDPDNDFYVLAKKGIKLEGMTSLKILFLRQCPRLMSMLNIKLFNDRLTNFFKGALESTVKTRDEKGIFRPDILQLMMDLRGKEVELTMEELASQSFGLYFAGFESMTTALSFFSYAMAVNTDVYEKLQAEIDSVWARTGGNLTYEAVNGMRYLDAALNESLRLYPAGSIVDRMCEKDFELPPVMPGEKPLLLKSGDVVWIPLRCIQHDADYYEEPDKFKPERFLQEMTLNLSPHITFGLGPRMCLGYRFAFLVMKIFLVDMLSKFELSVCPKTNVPMKFTSSSLVLSSEGGFWLQVKPRTMST